MIAWKQVIGALTSASVTVTAAVMLGTYAVINGNENGWTSGETVGAAAATTLLAVFLVLESRVGSPLMPLELFRLRNISVANVVGILLAGSMFGWFFLRRFTSSSCSATPRSRLASPTCRRH